jgi:hypothetical protein
MGHFEVGLKESDACMVVVSEGWMLWRGRQYVCRFEGEGVIGLNEG